MKTETPIENLKSFEEIQKETKARHKAQMATGVPSVGCELKEGNQIIFTKGESMFIGRIVEVREKALKVDYYWQPIMAALFGVEVFNWSCWLPKSVVIEENACLTTKKWFPHKFAGGHKIKKYFIENATKIFI